MHWALDDNVANVSFIHTKILVQPRVCPTTRLEMSIKLEELILSKVFCNILQMFIIIGTERKYCIYKHTVQLLNCFPYLKFLWHYLKNCLITAK